uniref:Suppressor APC domain-containing protein n=1 Tax=Ciona savignyi TaxID=51511 RepID=H2YCC7_CIOSA
MKTLFNILDDNGIGLVPLTEIERRWRDDAVPNLPGVLDCLRSVAPPDGLLSFETFVWGLRTALSRARHDKVKFKDATNRKTSSKQDLDSDTGILPPYYYRDIGKGKASRYQSKTASDNEDFKRGSYVKQSSRSNWLEDNDVTFGRYPVNTFSGIPQPQNHPDNRSFKSGHRRSNSGPISTAKVLPSPKRAPWPTSSRDEVRVTKMGYATKFSAVSSATEETQVNKINQSLEEIKSDSSADKSFLSLKSDLSICSLDPKKSSKSEDETSLLKMCMQDSGSEKSFQCVSEKSDLDRITANTLFINSDDKRSMNKMKPIGLSGKYIGITGTLQRAKSSACIPNHYGSLRRPVTTPPSTGVTSASESCFSGESMERRAGDRILRNAFSTQRRQYASAGESGDESNTRIIPTVTSSAERKRTGGTAPDMKPDVNATREGVGRRCNSASPPDRPVPKTARNSPPTSSDKYVNHSPSENTTTGRLGASKSHHNFSCEPETSKEGSGIPAGGYATVGRRRHGGSKKREPRRHTVTNGIDYNVLKLIKQLEQEKDVLLQGLETLNRGRQWFQDRICDVQEKQRLLSNNGLKPTSDVTENDATATQARIDGLLTKVSDMTKFVQSMSDDNTETCNDYDDGHMTDKQSRVVTALREQNHILTQDVTQKSDKIVQLEHEKSVLVQQLFQAKAEAQCVDGQVNTSIFI